MLAIIWDAQGKAAKSTKTISKTAREEVEEQQAADTQRIYQALEKLAKVSVSNKL